LTIEEGALNMEQDKREEELLVTDEKVDVKVRGVWQKLLTVFSCIFILYHIVYISQILVITTSIGVMSLSTHLGIHLAGILVLAFLLVRARSSQMGKGAPFYDIILAIIGAGISLYYGIYFKDEIVFKVGTGLHIYAILGLGLGALIIEACRRMLGLSYTLILVFFFTLPFYCGYLPGILYSPSQSWLRWGEFLFASYAGIFGVPLELSATIMCMYLFFSRLLVHSGAGDFFTDLSSASIGSVRGGSAKMAVIGSACFGAISGSAIATVAAIGSFTIPAMKKSGYSAVYAGAVGAVAGLGGMMIPPIMGAVIFLLADFVGMTYVNVCKHAAIPAVFFYFALFLFVDQEAVKLKIKGLPREILPSISKTIKNGYWYLIPLVVLLVLLILFNFAPQRAAIFASLALFLVSLPSKKNRLNLAKLAGACEEGLRYLLPLATAVAAAGIIVGCVTVTGIQLGISRELVKMSGGSIPVLLLLTAVVSFIMGLGVGIVGCYVFLATLVAPAMVTMGVPPIAAHLFIFYWAVVSDITPPLCITAFTAAGFAKANPMSVGWQATRIGIVTYILPFVWVLKPALITIGTPLQIITVIITSAIGICGVTLGVGGFFKGNLSWPQRIIILIGGFLVIFNTGVMVAAIGVVLMGVTISWQLLKSRRIISQSTTYPETDIAE
jgi:TRAP transporter 4TM/12TM fusion protein